MNSAGRPIRFLVSVVGSWMLLRVAMLWLETGSPLPAIREVLPVTGVAGATPSVAPTVAAAPDRALASDTVDPRSVQRAEEFPPPLLPRAARPMRVQFAAASVAPLDPAPGVAPGPDRRPSPQIGPLAAAPADERAWGWSASAWFVARGSGSPGVAPGAQLGGSQMGVRVDRAVGYGFALTARVAAPLQGRGAEISPGIAWQSKRLPLRAVAEYRLGLDGGASVPALGVSGGVSEARLPAGFRLEAYAQAGAIARRDVEGYADGAVRIARPVAAFERVRLDIGVGAWGAKQRDASRIDIGPSVALRLPVGGEGGARLQLDWRQRVAGDARPGSGLALTLGADL